MKYTTAPAIKAQVNPKDIDKMTERTDPITDVTPFIPHITGTISAFWLSPINLSPLGKGIPIKNPWSITRTDTIIILMVRL